MLRDVLYRDIVKARLSGNMEKLNESSLSRIWGYVQNAKRKSLAIISAFRKKDEGGEPISHAENLNRNKQMMSTLRSQGFGPTRLIGHWSECVDENIAYKDCPEDKKILTKEVSYAVVGITMDAAHKLANEYKQDSIVYLGPETNGKTVLVFRNGSIDSIGDFSPNKIAQAYSRIRGRPFAFEGFDLRPETWMDALVEMVLTRSYHK